MNPRKSAAILLRQVRRAAKRGDCDKLEVLTYLVKVDKDVKRAPVVHKRVLKTALRLAAKCWRET